MNKLKVCFCVCAAGLNPNMNVNCMEVGGLSLKEPPQPQSRLSQWTHSNSMDSLSGNSSNMENNLNKHGTLEGKHKQACTRSGNITDETAFPMNIFFEVIIWVNIIYFMLEIFENLIITVTFSSAVKHN